MSNALPAGSTSRCLCGWEGTISTPPAGESALCPACGKPISAGAESDAPIAGQAAARSWGQIFGDRARDAARTLAPVWQFVRAAAVCYWQKRFEIAAGYRLWLSDFFPLLQNPDTLRREVRRPLADDDSGTRLVDGVWHLDLPARCIVCGEEAPAGSLVEPRLVFDPYSMMFAPPAGLVAGVIVGWFAGGLWMALAGLFAGALVGYAIRREFSFLLKVWRCDKHAATRKVPFLAVLGRQMVLRLGTRALKLAFLRRSNEFDQMATPKKEPQGDSQMAVPSPLPAPPPGDGAPTNGQDDGGYTVRIEGPRGGG